MFIVSGSLFLKADLSFNYVCMRGFCVRVSACALRCPIRPEEGVRSPSTELPALVRCLSWVLENGLWSP